MIATDYEVKRVEPFDRVSIARSLSDFIVPEHTTKTLGGCAPAFKNYASFQLSSKKAAPFHVVADDGRLGSQMPGERTHVQMESNGSRKMERPTAKEDATTEKHHVLFERA